MTDLNKNIEKYLAFCRQQKNLDVKTLKAYRTDLTQFQTFIKNNGGQLSRSSILNYTAQLNETYKAKSSKRKVAAAKAFFNFLEYEGLLLENPFSKLRLKTQTPFILPKTIPIHTLNKLFTTAYAHLRNDCASDYDTHCAKRDIAVLELLFATGLRVSELCSLKTGDVDLVQGFIKVYGKGSKERIVQLTNEIVLIALKNYRDSIINPLEIADCFFINRLGNQLSEQSVRLMINRYTFLAGICERITPHMFRHTFATMLLEEDVDIRYIQQILGHSSILTTQIYTHVTSNKQREILTLKHPRNRVKV